MKKLKVKMIEDKLRGDYFLLIKDLLLILYSDLSSYKNASKTYSYIGDLINRLEKLIED